jgi:hypothetical protein
MAIEIWVEKRMQARRRREEAERLEPLLAAEFAQAIETFARSND